MLCSRAMPSPLDLLTTRLSSISHLFPKIIFSTSSLACSLMFRSHFTIFSKLFSFVISYTNIIPIAPL
ncbi:hypothetical protein FWK35_00009803 [Aphis craccivora]|uniref:Uncharacterized protein n=1 Tax=Aphis craccivora TaxID=307492 RepID=A0A6G0Z7M1_APHCR|nr:hypothetical protein FWK35_00009803 [Aphis craccivora]